MEKSACFLQRLELNTNCVLVWKGEFFDRKTRKIGMISIEWEQYSILHKTQLKIKRKNATCGNIDPKHNKKKFDHLRAWHY